MHVSAMDALVVSVDGRCHHVGMDASANGFTGILEVSDHRSGIGVLWSMGVVASWKSLGKGSGPEHKY